MQIKDKSSKKQQILPKYVITQDRDNVVKVTESTMLRVVPHCRDGKFYGYNLMCGDSLLGTFDDIGEAVTEMANIQDSKETAYEVSGYYDGDMEDDE